MRRKSGLRWAVFTGTVLGAVLAGNAQAGPFDGSRDADRAGFVVTETVIAWRLAPRWDESVNPWNWTWQAGYLDRNDARSAAWGGTVKLATDEDGFRVGPVLRHRRWLGDRVALDFGAGLYVFHAYEDGVMPTLDVTLSFDDVVGVYAGFDRLRSWESGTHHVGHVGLRFGKALGPAVTGAGLALAAAAL